MLYYQAHSDCCSKQTNKCNVLSWSLVGIRFVSSCCLCQTSGRGHKQREIQIKSKMSIILSNKHQDPVRRNCFPSTKKMNLIPTQQERNDKRKTSCKHPNHMGNFEQELKTSSAHKPRVTLPENQAELPELLQRKAHRGVWVKKHP